MIHYLTTGEFDVPCLDATRDVSYFIGQHLLMISLMLVVDLSPSVAFLGTHRVDVIFAPVQKDTG